MYITYGALLPGWDAAHYMNKVYCGIVLGFPSVQFAACSPG